MFLHKVLLEAYTAYDTDVLVDHFDVLYHEPITAGSPNDRIDREFKVCFATVLCAMSLSVFVVLTRA